MNQDHPLWFVDVETFGLEPARHAIFEIAIVAESGYERCWFLEPEGNEVAQASDMAINMTDYYGRLERAKKEKVRAEFVTPPSCPSFDSATKDPLWVPELYREQFAFYLAGRLQGHIAGNCVSFDARRLDAWIRKHGACPRWHYHILDVEAFAAGALGIEPPYKSDDLSVALGVGIPEDRHTALADAKWSRAMYMAAASRHRET